METSFTAFDHTQSAARIKEILESSDAEYQEKDSLPARDQLTFLNGYYVKCSSMFVDIRGSKKLVEKHTRPVLAKIYRSFISECIAVMRGNTNVAEINIEGDCVWGVFDTPYKPNIDEVFSDAARVSSMVDILNWRLRKQSYSEIAVGIGLSWGQALMVKAGYKNSGINNIVYMGTVVNEAAKLCSYGNREYLAKELHLSDDFYGNLNAENQKLCTRDYNKACYSSNIVNTAMDKWLTEQQKV